MTEKEKARAYDEAIEKARKLAADLPNGRNDRIYHIWDLENIFPELKEESEDERIKKTLINFFSKGAEYDSSTNGIKDRNIIAWLEKQGKEKPLSENEYERVINALKEGFKYHQLFNPTFGGIPCIEIVNWLEKQSEQKHNCGKDDEKIIKRIDSLLYAINESDFEDIHVWLKSLKGRTQPKQEWSEEDENRINHLIAYFEDKEGFTAEDDIEYANWLKSFRPQNTWKPSDEQLKVLFKYAEQNNKEGSILTSLYEQLKKLKGE